MKLYTFLQCVAISAWAISPGNAAAKTYKTCRKLPKDPDWPNPEIWEAALPGVIPIQQNSTTGPLPNYRFRAHSIEDVQAAVRFATEQNVRLSVITTGHDQLGRSDAGSGLLLDLSFLRGIKVHESFVTTEGGTDRLDHTAKTNVITPVPGVQAAVTFGPAAAGLYLNYGLDLSGLFTVSGAAGKFKDKTRHAKRYLVLVLAESAANLAKQPWLWPEDGARMAAMGRSPPSTGSESISG